MSRVSSHIDTTCRQTQRGSIGLRLHETVVRAIVERTENPVVIHDSVRAFYANTAAKRLFNLTDDLGPAGTMLSELWSSESCGKGGDAADQLCIRTTDDRMVSVSAMHVPVFGPSARTVATFLDNPDEVTVPLQRLVALERSETANVLSAGLAHEMAGPVFPLVTSLAEVSRHTDVLRRNPALQGDQAFGAIDECLEVAAAATEALASILRDYQTYLRPGTPGRAPEPCDARAAVERAVRMARPRLQALAEFDVVLDPVPPVRAIPGCLTQIALNLLNNAADALTAADPRTGGRIEVRLSVVADRVVLEVKDNGSGMVPGVLAHLFQPHVTSKVGTASLGMGLAICQALVHRMGGEISVSSLNGQGSTFRASLPPAEQPQ